MGERAAGEGKRVIQTELPCARTRRAPAATSRAATGPPWAASLHLDDGVAVTRHLGVVREQPQRLGQRLRHQQPVERVLVVARQPGHRRRVLRRDRQQDAACTLSAGPASGTHRLRFADAQWAVTPGQSAVLYDGEVCLGGGVIASAQALAPLAATA